MRLNIFCAALSAGVAVAVIGEGPMWVVGLNVAACVVNTLLALQKMLRARG